MTKQEIVIIADYTKEARLSLSEVCHICHTSPEVVQILIDHDIVSLQTTQFFTLEHIERIKQSLRLQHDLDINFAGIAIILNLLDNMKKMETEINLFKKHY